MEKWCSSPRPATIALSAAVVTIVLLLRSMVSRGAGNRESSRSSRNVSSEDEQMRQNALLTSAITQSENVTSRKAGDPRRGDKSMERDRDWVTVTV